MSDEVDPRFLGGESGMVLTNAHDMALVICINWDGACDVTANISHADAAKYLRTIADDFDRKAELS